jgi:hypothetical protein
LGFAYVETIGAVDEIARADEKQALRERFRDYGALMNRLIVLEDAELTTLAVGEINRSFKAIQMYYRDPPHRPTRKVLGDWMEALRVVERHASAGETDAAREALAAYSARINTDTLPLPDEAPASGSRY